MPCWVGNPHPRARALLILQSKEEFQADKLCRATRKLRFQFVTICGLQSQAVDGGPVILILVLSLTFASFQTQGISWLKSWELVFFGVFLYKELSRNPEFKRQERIAHPSDIGSKPLFQCISSWKERRNTWK